MEQLAIEGGQPVREEMIWYGKQWIDEKDIAAVSEVLRSPFITSGPKVERLEERLAEYTGAKYAVMVSSGTAALHCACLAAGLKEGDEVITTPMTFAASANCILYCGATPVFADIDIKTYNIDPQSIREKITEKTKAVIAVDFTGQPVKIEEIRGICEEFGLIFIEDGAHSIGSKYKNKMVGSLADMTIFSFHPVKTITGGEGGAILTNDDNLYKKLVLYHNHGRVNLPEEMEEIHEEPWYYEQQALGFNYRLTDFQSALIDSQLEKIEGFIARRKEIVRKYNEAFAEVPELILQEEIAEADTCRHLYIIRLDLERLNCSRLAFFNAMGAENVVPQIHYIPVYYFPYYQRKGYKKGLCPIAEFVYEGILSIPLFPKMTDYDVETVIHAVKKIIEHYRKR
ncbi:UDP-4-amino-4,6-dideoxy-N-acetyl-beta-L-altrosamine transaminase [Lachnospiraceae bacterium]|nr:UDP-4-amino-4,6-dideoxy-N-acetyl-beta-L-altrosamine transaminase [Lachnospiraceae bacterium]